MSALATYRIGALILSRFDSSRLPGKALKRLDDKPLIQWPIDTLKKMAGVIPIITTTDRTVDDPIQHFADTQDINCFRGNTYDIAKRIIDCCQEYQLDYFLRINGDSPFVNQNLIHDAVKLLKNQEYDFITNLIERTYPYGLSCELIKVKTFKENYPKYSEDQKEHITNFYYKNLKEFNFTALAKLDKDFSDIDWTVDTPEDLERLNAYLKKTNIKDIGNAELSILINDYEKIMRT